MAVSYKETKAGGSPVKPSGREPLPLKIAYIGGGSRGWALCLIHDLALCPELTGEVRLYDIDRPQAALNAEYGQWLQSHPDNRSKWKYRVAASLKAALKDADFVFASIQPGPIHLMKTDLEAPEKYGIYQSVGDTVGPGGCIRALRSIREYRPIAAAIAEYAPKAWVLNFTNPMSICTRALYEVFPEIKAYGCCHEVFGTQALLATQYIRKYGGPHVPRSEVRVNVLGINHFTWITDGTCRGVELLPMMREHIEQPSVVRKYTRREIPPEKVFLTNHQVTYELFKRFGILPAAGDRHLAEFVPWFLTSRESCWRWGFQLTPYSYRSGRYREAPKTLRRLLRAGNYPELKWAGEEYIEQMLAIAGRSKLRTNVNMPNTGQMKDVPHGAVVETNAMFSRNTVRPLNSGALPPNVNTLVLRHVVNQESLIRSVFDRDKDLAFQAFANDPLVSIPLDDAWRLFNDMLRGTNFSF